MAQHLSPGPEARGPGPRMMATERVERQSGRAVGRGGGRRELAGAKGGGCRGSGLL